MPKIFIKPAVQGHVIRHHEKISYQLAQEGEWVEEDTIWARKLLQGDVVECEPPQAQKPTAVKPKLNKEGE